MGSFRPTAMKPGTESLGSSRRRWIRSVSITLILSTQWVGVSSFLFINPTTTITATPTMSRMGRPTQLSLSTVTPPSHGQVELLEGKLKILERVVKELHQREAEQIKSSSDINSKQKVELEKLEHEIENQHATKEALDGEIKQLKEQMSSERRMHKQEIKDLSQTFEKGSAQMDQTIKSLQERLSSIQEKHEREIEELEQVSSKKALQMEQSLEQYEEKILAKDTEIDKLKKSTEKGLEETRSELQATYESKMESKRQEIDALKSKVTETEKKFLAEIVDLVKADKEKAEQIEIATASVQAAQSRENASKEDLKAMSKRLRISMFIQKLLWLSVEAIAEDNTELSQPTTTDGILRGGKPGFRNRILRSLMNLRRSGL